MGDYSELKRLATASLGEWYVTGELRYEDRRSGDLHGLHHDDERFIAVANPAAVLELIAEIEALRKDADRYRWLRVRSDTLATASISVTRWVEVSPTQSNGIPLSLEEMDEAIDVAMSKEPAHE